MSVMFKTVKRYYDMGFYSEEKVKVFVEKGKITKEEYKIITGKNYA